MLTQAAQTVAVDEYPGALKTPYILFLDEAER